MNSPLQNNTTKLEELLEIVNKAMDIERPDLPIIVNEATAEDVVLHKQCINSNGEVIVGTFELDEKLEKQNMLIDQIQSAIENKVITKPLLQDKTVTPMNESQEISADVGYNGLNTVIVEGIPTVAQGIPSIEISDDGLITASVEQSEGYVEGGVRNAYTQLLTSSSHTYIPNSQAIVIPARTYITGEQIVAGDENLRPENIRAGVTVFGVDGTGNFPDVTTLLEETSTATYYEDTLIQRLRPYAFYSWSNLSSINLLNCIYIGMYAFAQCSNLTNINAPRCSTISANAFSGTPIPSINFPCCERINGYAFSNCLSLRTAIFPQVSYLGYSAFYKCINLQHVELPMVKTIDYGAFARCSQLQTISLPTLSAVGNSLFQSCYNLTSLYLMGSSYCVLSNTNAFSSTPFMGYQGVTSSSCYIYVPASLLSKYQTGTNWVRFNSLFIGV